MLILHVNVVYAPGVNKTRLSTVGDSRPVRQLQKVQISFTFLVGSLFWGEQNELSYIFDGCLIALTEYRYL